MAERVQELDPSVYADHAAELDRLDAAQVEDFDAFWQSEVDKVKPAKIRGVVVRPPVDVSLALLQKLDEVAGSTDERAIHDVVRRMFGRDVMQTWIDAGMGIRELQTVVAWAGAAMRGKPVDFATAARLAGEALDAVEAQGKAGNRAQRRAPGKAGKGGRKKSAAAGP